MDTQETPQSADKAEDASLKAALPASVKSLPKRVWHFAKEAWKDNDLWVRSSAFGSGLTFIAQGAIGIYLLLAAPVVTILTGAVLCGAFIGIGAYGMYAGATGFHKSVKALWARTMEKSLPQLLAETVLVKKIAANPLVQKSLDSKAGKALQWAVKKTYSAAIVALSAVKPVVATAARAVKAFLGKAARHPLAKKIAMTPPARKIAKIRQGLSQKHSDLFMAALTLEGASFAAIAGVAIVGAQLTALPALTIGAFLSATILIPAWWGLGATVDIYRSTSVLLRTIRHWKDDKTGKPRVENKPAAEPVQQPQPAAISQLAAGTLTPAFTEASSTEKTPAASATPKPVLAAKPPRP